MTISDCVAHVREMEQSPELVVFDASKLCQICHAVRFEGVGHTVNGKILVYMDNKLEARGKQSCASINLRTCFGL